MTRGEPISEKVIQDYTSTLYPKRYSGSGFLYHARIVTDMLTGARMSDRHSDSILDVGCGIGLVSQLYPNFNIIGVDISDGMLSRNPYKWVKAPVESLPFKDDTFDFVIARSLLHHLDNLKVGLSEIFRVLKNGGKLVTWDPNHGFLYEIIRHLFQHTDRFSHLHKSLNADELCQAIEGAKFDIVEKRYIGYIAYPLIGFPDIIQFPISLSLGKMLMAVDDMISKSWLKKFSWSLLIKAVKP